MTNDTKKIRFTFRMNEQLSDQLEKEATQLGISKTAFITMILNQTINLKK